MEKNILCNYDVLANAILQQNVKDLQWALKILHSNSSKMAHFKPYAEKYYYECSNFLKSEWHDDLKFIAEKGD